MMKISKKWTADERLVIITKLIPIIQDSIYGGYYSRVGTPNLQSLANIATLPATDLESSRDYLEKL